MITATPVGRADRAELLLGLCLAYASQRSGLLIGTAESCTGGQAAALLTRLSGSSQWFEGGVVSYGNGVKLALLDVPEALLMQHGAVSEPVARAMATGLSNRLTQRPARLASVAFTGVAGPGGGSVNKPVGTVAFAWRLPGQEVSAFRWFAGDRRAVQAQAVWHGLACLTGLMVSAGAAGRLPAG